MAKLFKILGFIISWLLPFAVVYINHVITVDKTYDVDMLGLLLIIGLFTGLVRWINAKTRVWEIQDKHSIFILNWNNGKKILMAVLLTWVLYTIEDDLPKIQWSGVLITFCFIVGWLFTLLGSTKKKD